MKENVQRGAKWLDSVAPGWYREVDPVTLDMTSLNSCVLGQVFGSWGNGIDLLLGYPRPLLIGQSLEPTETACRDHGFSSGHVFWLAEIADRKAAEPTRTEGLIMAAQESET